MSCLEVDFKAPLNYLKICEFIMKCYKTNIYVLGILYVHINGHISVLLRNVDLWY